MDFSRLRKIAVALLAAIAIAFTSTAAYAQVDSNADSTNNSIQSTLDTLGLDITAMITTFVATVGDNYKTMLVLGFVLATGWIAYGHYKKGARSK
ncbi:MAG: hypothetical protein AAFN77_16810 [Planctomycetota bacterium]